MSRLKKIAAVVIALTIVFMIGCCISVNILLVWAWATNHTTVCGYR
jgi:hypothetical protein